MKAQNGSPIADWGVSENRRSAEPFGACGLTAIAAGVVVAGVSLLSGHALACVLVGAVLCGFPEAVGRCGVSHIGMTAPLFPRNRALWLKCVAAYTIAGCATSYGLGLVLVLVGSAVGEADPHVLTVTSGIAALAMMLRAMQLVRFHVPQCDRQTHKRWLGQFSMPTAAGMWVRTSGSL